MTLTPRARRVPIRWIALFANLLETNAQIVEGLGNCKIIVVVTTSATHARGASGARGAANGRTIRAVGVRKLWRL